MDSKFEKMDNQDDIYTAYEKLYKVSEKYEKLYRLAKKKLSDAWKFKKCIKHPWTFRPPNLQITNSSLMSNN